MEHEQRVEIALVRQQVAFEKEARETQAKEFERRLAELNRLHDEILRNYVSETVYSIGHKELVVRIEKIEQFNSELKGQYALVAMFITIGLALLTIGINVFLKFTGL